MLLTLRLVGIELRSPGAAYAAAGLARLEQLVIEGYRAGDGPRMPELRCHQLLLTLDTWAALVDRPHDGWRGRLRRTSVRLAAGHLRRETERLIDLATREPA